MHTTRKVQGKPRAPETTPAAGVSTSNGKFSLISDEKLIGLYTNLLKCQAMERRLNGNSNGDAALIRGGEAALVGTAIDLGPGDLVCSLDHGLLAALSEGNAIEKLMVGPGQHGGPGVRKGGSASKNGRPDTSFVHAAIGTALAYKTAANGRIAVVYGAGPEPDPLKEAIHIASVHSLPMIFVQQSPSHTRPTSSNGNKTRNAKEAPAQTPWFPVIAVDAHDVVAVYRVANESISRARLGRGPTLIEYQPFTLPSEKRNGRHADPVLNMEHYLRAKGLFDPRLKDGSAADL